MEDSPIAASSKTYRAATNLLADELDIEPGHTSRPKADYERAVDHVGDRLRKRARKYYRLGIRRGFIAACNRMLKGDLRLKGDTLWLYKAHVTVKVNVSYAPGDERERDSFRFTMSELEFDLSPDEEP